MVEWNYYVVEYARQKLRQGAKHFEVFVDIQITVEEAETAPIRSQDPSRNRLDPPLELWYIIAIILECEWDI